MSLKETGASERAQQALRARVIHLSTNDFGGAGSAALRFHASLLAAGHDSQLFVAESRSSHTVPAVTRVVSELFKVRIKAFARKHLPSKVFSRVRAHFAARERFSAKRKYLFFSVGESAVQGINPELVQRITSADVLFVHWVAGFANSFDVLQIQRKTGCKVYYTSMDMAHLTGGCHYYWQCTGFQVDCSDCPALDQRQKNYAAYQLRAKSVNILQMKATLLSGSQRIHEAGKRSAIQYADHQLLSLPLDADLFKPELAQRAPERSVQFRMLTNANDADDPRKGFEYLSQVLVCLEQQLLAGEEIGLLCLAPDRFSHLGLERVKVIQFDYCQGDATLAALYRKADLFVSTSIEDAGPMMVGEALMCGVPVVAFDVGIATELVEEGRNGFIVDRLDVRQMAVRILSVYRAQAPDLEQPGVIHERAARVFSHLHWADRVSDLISAEI